MLEYFEGLGLSKPQFMPTPDFLDQVTGGRPMTTKFGTLHDKYSSVATAPLRARCLTPIDQRPASAEQFSDCWKQSQECAVNIAEVEATIEGVQHPDRGCVQEHRVLTENDREGDGIEGGSIPTEYNQPYAYPWLYAMKSVAARQWQLTLTDVAALKQVAGQ